MDKTIRQIKRSKTRYRVLQDGYLQEVAERLSEDWLQTGLILDIPLCDLKALEDKFPQDVVKRVFEGLTLWKKKRMLEKMDQKDMIDELINALKEVKREDLVFMISSDRDSALHMTLNRSMSSSAIVHVVFTDKYLNRIATQMSTDSNDIFLNLGITEVQLKAIEYNHPKDIKRQALEGLIKWRNQTDMNTNDSESMFSTLSNAFTATKRQDLVDFIKTLRDEVTEKDSNGVNSDEIIEEMEQEPAVFNVRHADATSSAHNAKTIDEKKQPLMSVKKLTSFFENKISEIENASNRSGDTKQSVKEAVKLKYRQNEPKRNSLPNEGPAKQEKVSDPLCGPDGSLTNEDTSTLLHRLGLEKYYPEKLTLADVVGIHNISDNK